MKPALLLIREKQLEPWCCSPILEPCVIKLAVIDVDIKAKQVAKGPTGIGQSAQLLEVAPIFPVVLFQFHDQQIVLRTIDSAVVDDNIRKNPVCRALGVAVSYSVQQLPHLLGTVIFTIYVPAGKLLFHLHREPMRCGAFMDAMKVK